MLPWRGHILVHWLLGACLFGLLSIVLAWMGKLRFLFLVYSLAVFGMMFRGYFLGGYVFSGKDEFRMAIWLTVGALVAIVGAWSQFRKPRSTGRRASFVQGRGASRRLFGARPPRRPPSSPRRTVG